ncbi:MAG: ABC transporter permease [Niastella sp.]|nr:ABC transporter permease [Niastella sp.]
MLKNYCLIAWRNLRNNKAVSFINIGGLALGMAVAMLIGLWIWDELSFNRSNTNYDTIGQIARREVTNGEVFIADNSNHFPIPLAGELRANYNNLFKQVALATESNEHVLKVDNRLFTRQGLYVEPDFTNIFTLHMIAGSNAGFEAPRSILLSQSLAVSLFGNTDVIGKTVKLDNRYDIKVTGVFANLPSNSRFAEVSFLCPWSLLVATNPTVKQDLNNWGNSSFHVFVQTAPGISMANISQTIKDVYWPKITTTQPKPAAERTTLFLHPMKDWHLRSVWKNGVQAGGQLQIVWLFGLIGGFVLLLACINFMNLSTATSEKRAKEVGVRKTFGSARGQLIQQFLGESLLIVIIAFGVSIAMVSLSLDSFNKIAGKQIRFPFSSPDFWTLSTLFIIITALLAGSYPALYLSAFQPVKVLKGTFSGSWKGVVPRRILSGVQFTVSIVLIIGTIVVYRQIQFAQDRPIGYDRNGLIRIAMNTPDLSGKYDVLQKELLASGGATGFAQSSATTTENNYFDDRFNWEGKDANLPQQSFALMAVTYDFGKTVGWQFSQGRDFSRDFPTDNTAIILNEAAVKYMRLKDPVGKKIVWNGNTFTVTGVIKDMVTESPYKPVQQSIFFMVPNIGPVITIRLNPALSVSDAISRIAPVFTTMNPSAPFEYKFVDEEYGRKFAAEERIGILSGFFAALAIFISCLGIFGLASFVVRQRIREIGVRKVLGASVINLWGLLTREFVLLVLIAFVVAVPIANYFTRAWLDQYEYRTTISWLVFAAAGLGALIITLLTVSFQAFKAATANPVKSLRTE